MLTERQLQQIKSENELLLIQLEDVNEVIKLREIELDELRQTALEARQLQSRLDMNLIEFEQMQNNIGEKQQEAEGASMRMEELEQELYGSLKMENKYYNMLDENVSLQANLKDTTSELEEAAALYKKVKELKTQLTKTLSNLELAELEIESLKADLKEERAINAALVNKK